VISITPAGPPPGFATDVVRPARTWATGKGWSWAAPPPVGQSRKLPAHWTKVLDSLHEAHSGVCAYLSVYTHRSLDATSVDHYLPKSKHPIARAYDWSNYRLASRPMNTNKGEHEDVLDPFQLPARLFALNLLSGRVQINTAVAAVGTPLHREAQATLTRLKLNAGEYRELRLGYINEYLSECQQPGADAVLHARAALLLKSPFIYQEVMQQGW